nr:PREDICTED: plakophilin-2 [Latimeria chalumnae]|eukprot:XP_014348671.1 PREDICTED: plakophilin-2 [Latimeria chalumnae]
MSVPTSLTDTYIRTVLSKQVFKDQDSSTLAVPSDDRITHKKTAEKSFRLQQQVRMTMARKSKKELPNGTLRRTNSMPEEIHSHGFIETDFVHSPTQDFHYRENFMTSKYLKNENDLYTQVNYGTQHELSSSTKQCKSSPCKRVEVSHEDGPLYSGSTMGNTRKSTFHFGSMKYPMTLPRYAHSDVANLSPNGITNKHHYYSSYQKRQTVDYASGRNRFFSNTVPNHSTNPAFEKHNSTRNMTYVFGKDQSFANSGTVRHMRNMSFPYGANQSKRIQSSRWKQGTFHTFPPMAPSHPPSTSGAGVPLTAAAAAEATEGGDYIKTSQQMTFSETHNQGFPRGVSIGSAELGESNMTLEKAINMLTSENTHFLILATHFIQKQCQDPDARRKISSLKGIPKLLELLENEDVTVQQSACTILRNIVYKDNDKKLEVYNYGGIPILQELLQKTEDVETKTQITGLLWNLSSSDTLKDVLIQNVLKTMTDTIIKPYSDWPEEDYHIKYGVSDPTVFYNATGCLRNLSSSDADGRKQMRKCNGLIESLIHYVKGTIADHKSDDESTENCVCILHNLSYQLEKDFPGNYSQDRNGQNQTTLQPSETVGCFGSRSSKIKELQALDTTIKEEKANPSGEEFLWHSTTVRMYLSLIAMSEKPATQEASLGALQNLSAGNGPMPYTVAHTIVQKEKGLQHIRRLLYSDNLGVRNTAVSLLRNISCNSKLQNDLAKEVLFDLISTLPETVSDSEPKNEATASTCYVLKNLIQENPKHALTLLNNDGLKKIIHISSSDSNSHTNAGKSASALLYSMWQHDDLHKTYKKVSLQRGDFICP